MNYDYIIQRAIEFATICHEGQFRKDKKTPYATHPIAVMGISVKLYEEGYCLVKDINLDTYLTNRLYVALLGLGHDSAEDVEKYKNNEEQYVYDLNIFLGNVLNSNFCENLVEDFKLLNKNYSKNYLHYITKMLGHPFVILVKRGDLTHNMSDLQEGSLKDKYRLAEYILTH
jgi:(p)ppGpp synthase/HD superfamily hydrolase